MAFKRAERKESLKDVPMLSDYLEGLNPKDLKKIQGCIFVCESIVIAKSGKGYMLNFYNFCTFLFKKSSEASSLREYLDDNRVGTPCIEIDSTFKYQFCFGIDDEIESKVNWKTDSIGEIIQLTKESSKDSQSREDF